MNPLIETVLILGIPAFVVLWLAMIGSNRPTKPTPPMIELDLDTAGHLANLSDGQAIRDIHAWKRQGRTGFVNIPHNPDYNDQLTINEIKRHKDHLEKIGITIYE